MPRALLCLVLVVLSVGCVSNFAVQREREPLAVSGHSEDAAGMEPLIKTTRGTGLVVGIRIPLDMGGRSSAAGAGKKSELSPTDLLALVAGKSRAQLYRMATEPGRGPAPVTRRSSL